MARAPWRIFLLLWMGLCATAVQAADTAPATSPARKVRLFILSGQSNMAGMDPSATFTPAVTKAFPDDEVIVVKHAVSGQPISKWYKGWKDVPGERANGIGKIYDALMIKVKESVAGKPAPSSVTFVWMQGEADANHKGHGDLYAGALKGLLDQLQADLGRKDIDLVLGRISDYGNNLADRPDWNQIRKVQVEYAEGYGRGAWVDTDDLNGNKNGLHYPPEGYRKLGERFAQKAIELIGKGQSPGSVRRAFAVPMWPASLDQHFLMCITKAEFAARNVTTERYHYSVRGNLRGRGFCGGRGGWPDYRLRRLEAEDSADRNHDVWPGKEAS